MTKPEEPCQVCKTDNWYWPGDKYIGPKKWICGICHPEVIKYQP